MIWQTKSISTNDTEHLGEIFGKQLKGGEFFELVSDIGGGKTTFVRGLVRGAGSSDRVVSPSFTLSKQYKADNFTIYHFDFYRLNEPGILKEAIQEQKSERESVILVEWSGIIADILPENRLKIELQPLASNSDERTLTVKYTPEYINMLETVRQEWSTTKP